MSTKELTAEAALDGRVYLIFGRYYKRIPYGQEKNAKPDKYCECCGVKRSKNHIYGCADEQCTFCLKKAIVCPCEAYDTNFERSDLDEACSKASA